VAARAISSWAAHPAPHTPTPNEIGALVGSALLTKWRELFAVFVLSRADVAAKLLAYARINMPQEPSDDIRLLVAQGSLVLLTLIERGVLKFALDPLPEEAAAALAELQRAVTASGLRPEAPVTAAAEVIPVAPVVDHTDECAADFINLCSSDFRAKWMNRNTRAIYDQACAEGKI